MVPGARAFGPVVFGPERPSGDVGGEGRSGESVWRPGGKGPRSVTVGLPETEIALECMVISSPHSPTRLFLFPMSVLSSWPADGVIS
jgi:hypothetical protein